MGLGRRNLVRTHLEICMRILQGRQTAAPTLSDHARLRGTAASSIRCFSSFLEPLLLKTYLRRDALPG